MQGVNPNPRDHYLLSNFDETSIFLMHTFLSGEDLLGTQYNFLGKEIEGKRKKKSKRKIVENSYKGLGFDSLAVVTKA